MVSEEGQIAQKRNVHLLHHGLRRGEGNNGGGQGGRERARGRERAKGREMGDG